MHKDSSVLQSVWKYTTHFYPTLLHSTPSLRLCHISTISAAGAISCTLTCPSSYQENRYQGCVSTRSLRCPPQWSPWEAGDLHLFGSVTPRQGQKMNAVRMQSDVDDDGAAAGGGGDG